VVQARYRMRYSAPLAADLAFPLDVLVRANCVATVLDGFHRLLKAELIGEQMIGVKKVPKTPRHDRLHLSKAAARERFYIPEVGHLKRAEACELQLNCRDALQSPLPFHRGCGCRLSDRCTWPFWHGSGTTSITMPDWAELKRDAPCPMCLAQLTT
jgi:hypothetical protein